VTVLVRAVWIDDVDRARIDARSVDGFTGELGQTRIEQSGDAVIGITGAGSRADATPTRLRRAASAIARRVAAVLGTSADGVGAMAFEVDVASFDGPVDPDAALAAVADGLADGGYRFRMTDARQWSSGSIPAAPAGGGRPAAWARGERLAGGAAQARDLVNLTPTALTPARFADRARALLEPAGVAVTVLEPAALVAGGYGGILAIGAGSPNPPRLVELSVGGDAPEVVFVAKAVTFDSGGLSLKSPDALMDMKSDMAGAAAVVAAFALLPTIAPSRSFAAVIPIVENLPGPEAVRPGDVVRLRDGTTLEILNTDFEGRVILADALARAVELAPAAIVDIATLTYAARHALGDDLAALVATDDALAARVIEAGERAGEPVWRMPLLPERRALIESSIADLANFPGDPTGRTSSAALLLRQFVGDVPWAHLDMAAPAFKHAPDAFGAAGGTGWGVRLIAELVG